MKYIFLFLSVFFINTSKGNLLENDHNILPDVLNFKNQKFYIYNEPLKLFLKENPELYIKDFVMSDNPRGYVAEYQIINNRLFIIDFRVINPSINTTSYDDSIIEEVFPNKLNRFLSFYSGNIKLSNNNIIKIENGVIKKEV